MKRPSPSPVSLLLSGALLASLTLAGCGSSNGGGGEPVPRETTVMVYFLASDLTAGAIGNIEEMMRVGSTANMNVIIQTGGSKQTATEPAEDPNAMQAAGIDWTRVQRYVVNKGSLEQIEDLGAESEDKPDPAIDMGHATTLAAFLQWGAVHYPAKHYILLLWDHGGGVNGGFGPDDITKSRISVATVGQVLEAASTDQGVVFDVVGYDACLMANAEVAASLRAAASYMVASQDLVSSLSFAYEPFLEYVTTHPGASGAAIGTVIVDSFAEKMRAAKIEPFTLSVVDLSKAQELSDATDGFAGALSGYTANTPANRAAWRQIALARSRSLDWGTSAIFEEARDLVDMRDFVSRVVEGITTAIAPDAGLTAAGARLEAAIDEAVVHEVSEGSDVAATGLSVYFPAILWTYPGKRYTENTASGGTPYFAVAYTDGTTGLVKAYHAFYVANGEALQARMTMSVDPALPLNALIENGLDSALAAHWIPSCKLYTDGSPIAPAVTAPCYSGMWPVQTTGSVDEVELTFDSGLGWPKIMDHPVIMLPDHVSSVRLEDNGFLIPAYLFQSAETAAGYVEGYLRVEEDPPARDGGRLFHATGFERDALNPGKPEPLKDGQVYALGAYHVDDQGSAYFLRTDQTVMVSSSGLRITMSAIAGGEFAWFVTDLTGLVVASTRVPFLPSVD